MVWSTDICGGRSRAIHDCDYQRLGEHPRIIELLAEIVPRAEFDPDTADPFNAQSFILELAARSASGPLAGPCLTRAVDLCRHYSIWAPSFIAERDLRDALLLDWSFEIGGQPVVGYPDSLAYNDLGEIERFFCEFAPAFCGGALVEPDAWRLVDASTAQDTLIRFELVRVESPQR